MMMEKSIMCVIFGDDVDVGVDVSVVAQRRKSIASKAFVFCADEFARKALKEAAKVREA